MIMGLELLGRNVAEPDATSFDHTDGLLFSEFVVFLVY